MEITGNLIEVLPEQYGESAKGKWVRGGFIIETIEQYPRKIAFTLWGEQKVENIKTVALNTTLKVTFEIESREWQEKWYTEARVSKITFHGAPKTEQPKTEQKTEQPYIAPPQTEPVQQPAQQQVQQADQTYIAPPQTEQKAPDPIETADNKDDLPF